MWWLAIPLVLGFIALVLWMPRNTDDSKARTAAKVRMDLLGLQGLLDEYHTKFNRYPTSTEGIRALISSGLSPSAISPRDPWGQPYNYKERNDRPPQIYSSGPNRVDESMGGDDIYLQQSP